MSKDWMVTTFDDTAPVFREEHMEYLVYQREACPTSGKLHWQAYVKFFTRKRMLTAKALFGTGAHLEVCRGGSAKAIEYCTKDASRVEPYIEHGLRPEEKKVMNIVEMLRTETPTEILEANPKIWRSIRSLQVVHGLVSAKRDFMTKGLLFLGPSGCGKSRSSALISEYLGMSYYAEPTMKWFDNYTQEESIIVEEIREIPTSFLLRLIDRYPMMLPIKGGYTPMRSEYVFMSSNLSEELLFGSMDLKTIEAFKRRIYIVDFYKYQNN